MHCAKNIFILISLLYMPQQSIYTKSHTQKSPTTLWAIPTTIIGSLIACCGFSWFRKPEKSPSTSSIYAITLWPTKKQPHTTTPTIGIVKKYIEQKKQISTSLAIGNTVVTTTSHPPKAGNDNNPFWLVSPGFMGNRPQKYSQEPEPESGLEQAAAFIKHGIITGPCITFNYNDARRAFNFAQHDDLTRLQSAFNTIPKERPVILVGTCRGATALLQLLTKLDTKEYTRIKAVILESPAISLQTLAHKVAHSYVGWLPRSPAIIHAFFTLWFPNYDPYYPTFLSKMSKIPTDLPIFIAHLHGDKVIDEQDITTIEKTLHKTGHTNVHVARIKDQTHTITHARLSRVPAFQQEVHAFLKRYNLYSERSDPTLQSACSGA